MSRAAGARALVAIVAAASVCAQVPRDGGSPSRTVVLLPPLPEPPPMRRGGRDARGYRVIAVGNGGTITGRVTWTGALPVMAPRPVPRDLSAACGRTQPFPALRVTDGAVADVVISLADVTAGVAARPVPVDLALRRCALEPHVRVAVLGSTLAVTSADPGPHHLHAGLGVRDPEPWWALALRPGEVPARTLDREGIVRVVGDVDRPWQLAYVHVVAHPYAVVSGADGRYVLRDVPPGQYVLHAWHEGFVPEGTATDGRPQWSDPRELDRRTEVSAGGTAVVDLTLSLAGFALR